MDGFETLYARVEALKIVVRNLILNSVVTNEELYRINASDGVDKAHNAASLQVSRLRSDVIGHADLERMKMMIEAEIDQLFAGLSDL